VYWMPPYIVEAAEVEMLAQASMSALLHALDVTKY
jgi:adenosylmethionine-8-amino-7-oxononanoate aminotransferase